MKWWGWGDEAVSFTHDDKPALGPFVRRHIGIDVDRADSRPVAFGALRLPEPTLPDGLRADLEAAVGPEHLSTAAMDRVVHARGKSLTDLVRHRRGELGRVPDVVVFPGDEAAVQAVMAAALAADAVVIPFGGGSNISGSLEAPADERRPSCRSTCARLDRVLGDRRDARAWRASRPACSARSSRSSSTPGAGRSGTSPTASPTRRSAAGSRPGRRACSPTSTATSPTSRAGCAW